MRSSIVDLESRGGSVIVLISMGSYFAPLADRVDRIDLGGAVVPCLRILALRLVVSPDVWLVGVECIGVGILSIRRGILPVYI